MKVKSKALESFSPVEITITAESKRELEVLFACFNTSRPELNKSIESLNIKEFEQGEPNRIVNDLFQTIENHLVKLGNIYTPKP